MATQFTFELVEATDEDNSDDFPTTTLKVRAEDQSGSPISDGVVTVDSDATGESRTADLEGYGMNVAINEVGIPATVTVEATGYETASVQVTESDIDGSHTVDGTQQ